MRKPQINAFSSASDEIKGALSLEDALFPDVRAMRLKALQNKAMDVNAAKTHRDDIAGIKVSRPQESRSYRALKNEQGGKRIFSVFTRTRTVEKTAPAQEENETEDGRAEPFVLEKEQVFSPQETQKNLLDIGEAAYAALTLLWCAACVWAAWALYVSGGLMLNTAGGLICVMLSVPVVLGHFMQAKASGAAQAHQARVTELRNLHSKIETQIKTLERMTENLNGRAGETLEHLSLKRQDVETTLSGLESRLQAVRIAGEKYAEGISAHAGTFLQQAQSLEMQMAGASDMYEKRLKSIRSAAAEAVQHVREASNQIQAQALSIGHAAETAQEKAHAAHESMQSYAQDVHLLSDRVILRTDGLRQSITDMTGVFDSKASAVMAKIGAAQKELSGHINALETTANNVAVTFEKSHGAVKNIVKEAGVSMLSLSAQADNFITITEKMTGRIIGAVEAARGYKDEISEQIEMIVGASEQAENRMETSVNILSSTMDSVGVAAQDTIARLETVQGKIRAQADDLIEVSSAALEAAYHSTDTFQKQSETLFRASRRAMDVAQSLEATKNKAVQGGTMSSVRFVIESLHSLSVDLTRMSMGGIEQGMWNDFKAGDMSVFTKKMAEICAHMPLQKSRDKFLADTEFRNAVQKFITQFEQMFDTALQNDADGVLALALGGGDMGRLYEALCDVAGKRSCLKRTKL